jgi:hypothetical protein
MRSARKGRQRPPRLREAENEQQNCGSCRHFNRGMCAKYGDYPVRPDQVSDSFQPRRGSM